MIQPRSLLASIIVAMSIATSQETQGQCVPQTLFPTDTADYFGASVAVSDEFAVVGALGPYIHTPVHVFRREGESWVTSQIIYTSENQYYFGRSVSLSGSVLAVTSSGAAHFYRLEGATWVEHQVVETSDPEGAGFGGVVIVEENVAVIAGRYFTKPNHSTGAAYVYRFNGVTWDYEQRLVSAQVDDYDVFGKSLALSGNSIVVGMHDNAQVFRFDGSTWNYEQTLTVPGANPFFPGELPVAMNNQTILIGATHDSDNSGAVYAFEFDGAAWQLVQQLVALDGQESESPASFFGKPVAISGDRALIGASTHSHDLNYTGTTYVFRFDGVQWLQEQEFNAPQPGSDYARSLAISGDFALVGQSGAVHIYCLGPGACCDHASGVCTPDTLNSTCLGPHQDWSDLPDCSTVDCAPIVGACCAGLTELESTCEQTIMSDCPSGLTVFFTPDSSCEDVSCRQPCYSQETSGSTFQLASGFGQTVAIDGEIAVVGSYVDEGFWGTGAATVFMFQDDAWEETAELHPLAYQFYDRFGASVAVSGNAVVVGAPSENAGGYPLPAAYVFRYDGVSWNQEARLSPQEGAPYFGRFVDISDDELIVSSRDAIYLFRFNGAQWVQEQKVTGLGGVPPVAIEHDVALLGGNVF